MFTCLSLSISCYNTLTFKVSAVTVIVTCLLNLLNYFSHLQQTEVFDHSLQWEAYLLVISVIVS